MEAFFFKHINARMRILALFYFTNKKALPGKEKPGGPALAKHSCPTRRQEYFYLQKMLIQVFTELSNTRRMLPTAPIIVHLSCGDIVVPSKKYLSSISILFILVLFIFSFPLPEPVRQEHHRPSR